MITGPSLPFRIPDVYAGFAEIRGILRSEKETLVLDFEVKESVLDMLRLASNEVKIPVAEIAAIELKKGWFSRWPIIAVNRLVTLRQVPGSRSGELRLKITRKDTAAAEEFVSRLQMALVNRGLKDLLDQQ